MSIVHYPVYLNKETRDRKTSHKFVELYIFYIEPWDSMDLVLSVIHSYMYNVHAHLSWDSLTRDHQSFSCTQGWIKSRLPVFFITDSFRTQRDWIDSFTIFTGNRQFWNNWDVSFDTGFSYWNSCTWKIWRGKKLTHTPMSPWILKTQVGGW